MRSFAIILLLMLLSLPLAISQPQTLSLPESLSTLESKLVFCKEALREQELRIQSLEDSLRQADESSRVLEQDLQEALKYQESLKARIETLELRLTSVSKSLEVSKNLSSKIDTEYIPRLERQAKVMKWQRTALWIAVGIIVVEGVVIWVK